MPAARWRTGRRRLAALAALLVVAVALLLAGAGLLSRPAGEPGAPGAGPAGRRALLYDSLAREYPNETLDRLLVETLESAGYRVDAYIGGEAGLEPLESLERYSLVIIRAHGAYNGDPNSTRPLGTYIYTGLLYGEAAQRYGKAWLDAAIRSGDLALAVIPPPGYRGDPSRLPKYIAVSPQFIARHNHRLQPGTIIVFTGCYGLADERLASLLLSLGARAYIAWTGNVTWTQADAALAALVKALARGEPPAEAVSSLPAYLRVDQTTGSRLEAVTSG